MPPLIRCTLPSSSSSRGRLGQNQECCPEVYSNDAQEELADGEFKIRVAMLIYFEARTLQETSTRELLTTVRDTKKKMLNGFSEDEPFDTVYLTGFIIL